MSPDTDLASTYSILGYDPHAQEWGVAVQSKAFAVGGMVPWAQAGVGAIATQAWTNKSFGPRGLKLLKRGHDPLDVIQHLIGSDADGARRQLAVMDAQGRTANYTGENCTAWAGGIAEPNVSVQGNILAGERVVKQMRAAFHKTQGKLALRLLAALDAGQRAGGDTRGQQAAALLVVREKSDIDGIGDVYVDLRVDDHTTPLAELRRLYQIWERELYPHLEGNRITALLQEKKYARAQKLHRDFSINAERLARKFPRDAQLLNVLAWQLAKNALGLDAADKYARRAVKLEPHNPDIRDTWAEVLYQRGEVARAIAIAQELVEKNPQRADLKAQLEKFSRAAKPKRRR
jgi:uncharacterized Ntn-hydrolase superfamily protein